ncbi:unnamed protein product [Effrenium voratum]|uniref:Uncharacterized protein n=1 Tax=Effrenium voratum TaxID=2562239 RepID=A0AA36HXG6_9DINO|nr:unnamed protein product [Effrenium voratum]
MPIALPAVDVERRAKVIERLRQLWEQEEVPAWHRRLFEEKYCQGTYGSEFLIREVQALKSGTAPVQEVQKAIWHREEVLVRLTLLRTGFSDEEILTAGSLPRRHLAEQLQELRRAGARCVEALSAWRRSVAPLQVGCVPGWPYAGPTGEVDDATEDYLVHLADDAVVRAFETVVEVSPECDPFLLFRSGGTSWKESGKLCPPAVADRARRGQPSPGRDPKNWSSQNGLNVRGCSWGSKRSRSPGCLSQAPRGTERRFCRASSRAGPGPPPQTASPAKTAWTAWGWTKLCPRSCRDL